MGWPSAPDLTAAAVELGATDGFLDLPGLRIHYVRMGDGPPVVLLHGFPECWTSWRRQLPALAASGFTVIAPDLRGYHLTGGPGREYDFRTLAGDVAHLLDALGYAQAYVVGHDWGGVMAWVAAMLHPERIRRLVVMDAAHPAAFLRELRRGDQARRSWYVLLFQLPWLPEWVLRQDYGRGLLQGLRRATVNRRAISSQDIVRLLQLWNDGHSLHGGLNYYRGMRSTIADRSLRESARRIDAPTLLLWGTQDPFGGVALTEGLEEWVPNLRVHIMENTGHWVHQERPDDVNRLLVNFLQVDR